MSRRKRYLDNTVPADNTANVVRPVNRMIQVKQQDTPARREKETREYKVIQERAKYTPANPRQASIGPYREKTALDRAGGRLYAAAEQRRKDAEDREAAGVVLNSLFKPIFPSTYVDMAAAIKNGQVNNLSDALAAPYLTDSWSMRNPGKALVTDIAAPSVLGGVSKIVRGTGIPLGNGIKWHLRLPINDKYYYRQGKGLIDDANSSGVIRVRSSAAPEASSDNHVVRLLRKDFNVPFFMKGRPWFNDKLETIVNTGGGNYQWMPITKNGTFKPNAKVTDRGIMGRVTPLLNGEPGLARASDFIGFTPRKLGYTSRRLDSGIPTPDNVKYSFGIPSFDELSNLYTRVANEYKAKQLSVINKAHDDVIEYLGSDKNIERLINAGATKEQAERIAFDMQQNAMATKGTIGLPNSSTALGEYEPDFKVNLKMNVPIWSNESRLRPIFEPEYIVREGIPLEDTYSTVVHELGGHGATLGYNPMYGIEDPKVQKLYGETIKQWSPSTEQVYNHNGLLQPSRKPEYMTLSETDPVEKHIRYLEDVDEYSTRARASHILPSTTDMLSLYKYFTKETVDRLKDNVWTISPFLVGSGLAAKNK